MYNIISTADAVSRWNSLGVELPEELATAVETFEAIRWVETGHAVQFDLTDITAANAEEKVVDFANRLMPALKTGDHTSRTPLEEAKQRMLEAAASDVLGKATAAVPVVIEQLTPEFDKHAAAYVAAVADLPEKFDAASLLQAGAGAVAAYQIALSEAAHLNQASSWVAGTRALPGFTGLNVDVPLRILRPSNALQLAKLDAALYMNVDQAMDALNKVFYTAAREGIEFGINTLRECAELRRSLAITPETFSSGVTMAR
ncbi:Uncharacterised protein [Rhodococcus rhodochrous]|uniref:hypothetical protein n=1 Tax=Rhodococcus rhodochrous TaxID=1829 RepID=UPI0007508AAA|nr:hypothetical protein [Rhodococcus rhodochrous]MDO1485103.1 hypothetical protein [Rhodococcus rhodochrous]SNV10164.1 Uncharacterised protein [Rhodococcus rhodochrous]